MVSISGSKKLKRQMAPNFWSISRKNSRFVITVKPGQHSKHRSIPTAVLLRDVLQIVRTLREAKSAIYAGRVKVDGVIRKSLHHGIGFMDTVTLEGSGDTYRMIPKDGRILYPIKMSDDAQASKKICKVTSRVSIRGGKTQIGFHDGRSLISEESVRVGDSCLMQVPEQKILKVIRLDVGSLVIVIRGANAGKTGTVDEIKKGTFVLPKMVTITLGDKKIDIPTSIVVVIGTAESVVQIE